MEASLTTSLNGRTKFKPKFDWPNLLNQTGAVALDTENFGLDREFIDGTGYKLGFSLCVKIEGTYYKEYFPTGHRMGTVTENMPQEEWQVILDLVATKKVFLFNAHYDNRVLRTAYGITLKDYIDLMRLTHIDDENYAPARNLENMVKKYCKDVEPKKKSTEMLNMITLLGWGFFTFEQLNEYGEHDAFMTYRLAEEAINKLAKRGEANNVFNYWKKIEQDNYESTYAMKSRGILVNLDACREYIETGTKEIQRVVSELGFDPSIRKNMERVFWEELKLPVIYNKKKSKSTGQFYESATFDSDAMERYELMLEARVNNEGSELAKKVLEYRGWTQGISLYYKKYIDLAYPDGRVRPSYLYHGTKTGRFSCIEPNLQQIPKEINPDHPKPWVDNLKRDIFYAEDGYELWEFDYAQLEFRLGAHFSKEQVLLEAFNDDDRDVFREMALLLTMPRQDCKTLTYTINYGGGAQRIMDVFGASQAKAKQHIVSFYETYPNLRRANMAAKLKAEKNLKIQYWSGRYRHFEFKEQGFKAFNSYIQGGAADLVKLAMNRIHNELPEVRMLLQVHDSLIFELPVARREEYKAAIKEIMANPGGLEWTVHLKTDGHLLGAG